MSPVTHFFVSWAFAETVSKNIRDRRLIVFSGIAPDIDGLGAVFDVISPLIGGLHTTFYTDYHHVLLHGLPGAILIAMIAALIGKEQCVSDKARLSYSVRGRIKLRLRCLGNGGINMENNRKIAKVYRKVSINEQPSDFEYWQTQSYEARLAALETIIREYHGWKDGFEPRLERVCTIVKRQ